MKRFDFQLGRVQDWREKQVSVEVAKLANAVRVVRDVDARIAELDREECEAEQAVVAQTCAVAGDLRRLDSFRGYAARKRQSLAAEREAAERALADQRAKALAARRDYELIARLHRRRLSEWQSEMEKEIEKQATELWLARAARDQRLAAAAPDASRTQTSMFDDPRFAQA